MSTKATKKETTKKETNEKKEFTLERFFTLWIYKSKKGNKYLSGVTEDGEKLRGFFNSKKENPKEPDIRIYTVNKKGDISKEEFISLWCNANAESGKKYISGKIDGKRVVGFFNSKAEVNGVIPYINVYYSDNEQNESKEENKPKYSKKEEPEFEEMKTDDDLPF